MAAVTQTIESYLQGVSRESDKDKAPGSVKEARNAYPDVTFGMTKRPGSIFTTDLGAASDLDDAYFFIFRYNDKEEMYIGMVYNKSLRLKNIATGVEATIAGGTDVNYLDGTKEDFRYRQKQNDFLLLNKTVTTDMSDDLSPGTVTGEVNTIAELPEASELTEGDIYVIRGITGAQDDYVLIWDGQTWQETVYPGSRYKLDGDTMPHQLIRTATDTFTFGPATWGERVSGIPGTTGNSRRPSFVGHKITNLFYHKNRLGFTSMDNVILGQPLDFYNFWRNSSLTTTDADPIDLTASSLQDVYLFAVQPMTQGLLLFSTREQFIMTAGTNGVLTPSTAAIRSVSTYEMYTNIDPILVDDDVFFTTQANNYTRVLSMSTRGDNNNPVFNDVGKPVTTYIPIGINRAFGSNQNQFIALYDNTKSSVFFYRFYKVDNQNQLRSWFKWDFAGKVLGCFMEQDVIFVAVSANDKVYMNVAYINPNNQVPIVQTPQGQIYSNPTLDYLQQPVSVTYDTNTKLSTITTTTVDPNNAEWKPVAIEVYSGGQANGAFWDLTKTSDTTYTVNANLSDITGLLFGFTYPMDIEIPKTYYRNGANVDYTASLTISRMKFAMGKTGAVSFEVRPRGASDFKEVGEVDISNWYLLDSAPIDDERFFTVPVHQRNDNFDVRISSDSPYPVSLLSMSWEGQYSPRYYRRT
jgi:hypothetical protein